MCVVGTGMPTATNGSRTHIRAAGKRTFTGTFSILTVGTPRYARMERFTTVPITSPKGLKMSVILESQAGDELIILEEFHASPEGMPFSWETSRRFTIGERVRYVSFFQDQHFKDHPGLGWMVLFEGADGKRYAATQTYFVTEECWQGLKRFFAKRLLRDPKRRRAPHP